MGDVRSGAGVLRLVHGPLPREMAAFVRHWSHLLQSDSYLTSSRDQLVTLTTVSPPQQVRIIGITPDHGLLRTMPERTGWSSEKQGYIDLQPDGNSFDIMSGLIKSKS